MAQTSLSGSGISIESAAGQMSYSLGSLNHIISGHSRMFSPGVLQVHNSSPFKVLQENQISAWPNPVIGSLNIKLEPNPLCPVSFQIYDLNGQLLGNYSYSENKSSISMLSYPSGTYLLKIISPQQIPITIKINKI
jgi:hypothetical protein